MREFILAFIVCGLFLCGCVERESNADVGVRLVQVDSMMGKYADSAYAMIKTIDTELLKRSSDKAYYALLYTQAQYKNGDSIGNDSLISAAVDYYADNHDPEKYTRALIYKGAAYSDIGDYRMAIEWYKKAEDVADTSDYMNLGQINIRMGSLYKNAYIGNSVDVEKYKKALYYYKKAKNKKYQLACLSSIGGLYRIWNVDSAYFYLNRAIELARAIGDSTLVYNNLSMLMGAYYTDSLFYKAKEVAVYVIKNGRGSSYVDDFYHFASRAYANLGMIDSAEYYLNKQIKYRAPEKEIKRLLCLIEIEKAKGNYKKVHEYDTRCFRLSDSILRHSARNDLFKIEKLYDKSAVELENAVLTKKAERTYFIIVCITLLLVIIAISSWMFIIKKRRQMQDNLVLIEQLRKESLESKNTIISKLDNESKLKDALEHQIKMMKELIESAYRCGNNTDKFMERFKESVRVNKMNDKFWKDLRYFVDENYNKVITRVAYSYPNLSDEELNFIGLLCCKFSYLEITICMGYKNERSACNKRWRIAQKMGIDILLDDYVQHAINEDYVI